MKNDERIIDWYKNQACKVFDDKSSELLSSALGFDDKSYTKQKVFWDQDDKSCSKKQRIFWDVDDVILESADAIIDIVNDLYYTDETKNTKKTKYDKKDYGLKSIWSGFEGPEGRDRLHEMFNSEEFWSRVKINKVFIDMLINGDLVEYDNYFVTKGNDENHRKKKEFLKEILGFFDERKVFENIENKYIAIGPTDNGGDKSIVDMSDGIQIDDVFDNLVKTNAKVKILLKNGVDTEYNLGFGVGEGENGRELLDNLYICYDMEDVRKILEFNREFFEL